MYIMYEKTLEGIGLTQGEIKVYSALLKIGESTTGKIIEESKLSSGKIYEILDKLIDKGLATFIVKEKTKYFSPTNPKKILEYVDRKKEEIENKKREVESILQELIHIHNLKKEDYKAVIYKGYEGLKTAIFESLEELNKNDIWMSMGTGSNRTEQVLWMWNKFEKLRVEKEINLKIIASNEENINNFLESKYMKAKILNIGGKVPVDIAGNSVLIYNFEDLSVVKITSCDVANSFRDFFDHLWILGK